MTSKNIEPPWKRWLDRLLVLDVFLVLGGAVWFAVAVIADGQGFTAPMQQFQRLWDPLFTPAIGATHGSRTDQRPLELVAASNAAGSSEKRQLKSNAA